MEVSEVQRLYKEGKYLTIIDRVSDLPNPNIEIINLNVLCYSNVGRSEEGYRYLLEHKEKYCVDDIRRATFYLEEGYCLWRLGNLEESEIILLKGLEIVEPLGDSIVHAGLLSRLEVLKDNTGEFTRSIEYGNQALAMFRRLGNIQGIIYTLYILGYVYQVQGELDTAMANYDEALSLFINFDNNKLLGSILRNRSKVMFDQGNAKGALETINNSIIIFEDMEGAFWELCHCYQRIAEYYGKLGEWEQATEYIQRQDNLETLHSDLRLQHINFYTHALFLKDRGWKEDKAESEKLFRKLLTQPKIRQELSLASYGHLLQLLLEDRVEEIESVVDEVEPLLAHLKFETERELLNNTLLTIFQIESEILAKQGNLEKAVSTIEDAKRIAFENQIYSAIIQISKQQDRYRSELLMLREIGQRQLPERSKPYIDILQEVIKMPNELLPNELYQHKFLLSPVRLAIVRLLMNNVRLTTVEIKTSLDLTWNMFNTHLDALKKKNYVVVDYEFEDGNPVHYVSLHPNTMMEFQDLVDLLRIFVESVHTVAKL